MPTAPDPSCTPRTRPDGPCSPPDPPSRRTFSPPARRSAAHWRWAAGHPPPRQRPGHRTCHSAAPVVHSPDDTWRTVLDDADLVWQKMPTTWYEGPYLGNGLLGSGIYAEPGGRPRPSASTSSTPKSRTTAREFGSLFGLARLPIGHFTLEPVGTITGLDWRLRLRDAELDRHAHHHRGHPDAPRLRPLLQRSCSPSRSPRARASATSAGSSTRPTRSARVPPSNRSAGRIHGQPARRRSSSTASVTAAVQPLLAGGQHVTAWRERTGAPGARCTSPSRTPTRRRPHATARCVRSRPRSALPYDAARRSPIAPGGTRFYRKSFLSLPDARLQRFYWIQLYKTASAARKDAPVMATSRPLAGAHTVARTPGGTSTSSWSTG